MDTELQTFEQVAQGKQDETDGYEIDAIGSKISETEQGDENSKYTEDNSGPEGCRFRGGKFHFVLL